MIGRRAVIGLSLLSALLFGAFAAQGASAANSNNTTAFTCVEKASGGFSDAHCDTTASPGTFGHEAIANDTTTAIDGTNLNVTNSTKDSEPAILKGVLAGAKLEIVCAKVKNDTTKSFIHNTEPVSKQHTVTGTARTEFSECKVNLIKNCEVEEPIVSEATFHGVDGLEGPKGEKGAMGVEFLPENEGVFASIKFKVNPLCVLSGQTFPVTGSVIATGGPTTESAQNNKHTGATLVFTPKFKMQTLKLGPSAAEFSTIATATMAGGGKPITLTTTT